MLSDICYLPSFQFKRMLNKELSHFSESKSGNQISEYICSTFLGKYKLLCLKEKSYILTFLQMIIHRICAMLQTLYAVDLLTFCLTDKQQEADIHLSRTQHEEASDLGISGGGRSLSSKDGTSLSQSQCSVLSTNTTTPGMTGRFLNLSVDK